MMITLLQLAGFLVAVFAFVVLIDTRSKSTKRRLGLAGLMAFGLLSLGSGLRAYFSGAEISHFSTRYGAIHWVQDVAVGALFLLMALVLYVKTPSKEEGRSKPPENNARDVT